MKSLISNLVLMTVLFFLPFYSPGQGTFTVTFDGSPFQPVGTAYGFTNYTESGVSFTPIDPNAPWAQFGRTKGGGDLAGLVPDNGSAYLQGAATDSLKFWMIDDSLFGVVSVELAGYSTVVPDFAVQFVGYRPDGSTVTADFSGSGLNFQMFNFSTEFSGLSRVEVSTVGWSLDNLDINVPEPASWTVLLLGGVLLFLVRRRGRGYVHCTLFV